MKAALLSVAGRWHRAAQRQRTQRLLMFRNIPAGSQYDTLAPAILASASYAPAVVRRGCPPPEYDNKLLLRYFS